MTPICKTHDWRPVAGTGLMQCARCKDIKAAWGRDIFSGSDYHG